MKAKYLSIFAILLWLAGAAIVGSLYYGGKTETTSDGRQAVILSVAERDFVLGEMRQMLASVQEIIEAVADDDMASVKESALAMGSAEVRNVPKSLMLKLPKDFKSMGKLTHLEFDNLAALSNQGGPAALAKLGDLLGNCVGCHESFIPIPKKNHWCAQSRSPIDMILHGWSMSWFQAKQQLSTMSL